jgi:hypothetical protein
LNGVTQHPFSDYLNGISYLAVKQIDTSPEQCAAGKDSLQAMVGDGYNWAGVWRLLFLHLIGVCRYRVGFVVDFAIIFGALLLALHPWRVVVYVTLSVAAVYYAVIVLSVAIRRFRGGGVTIPKSQAKNA